MELLECARLWACRAVDTKVGSRERRACVSDRGSNRARPCGCGSTAGGARLAALHSATHRLPVRDGGESNHPAAGSAKTVGGQARYRDLAASPSSARKAPDRNNQALGCPAVPASMQMLHDC